MVIIGRAHRLKRRRATEAARAARSPRILSRTRARDSLAALAGALALAIAGCAAGAPRAPTVRPLMVQVPVLRETPCPAPALVDPALPLAGLKPEAQPADTMRAYAAAVAILKGAVRERDAVLAGCARGDRPARAQAESRQ